MSFILLGILNSQAAGAVAGGGSYDLLETTVLDSDTASVTFSGLVAAYGSTYKHLQIRGTARNTRNTGGQGALFSRFNGDTGSNYAFHRLYGNGSSVLSSATTSASTIFTSRLSQANDSSGIFASFVIDILDPFDTGKNTTTRSLNGSVGNETTIYVYSGLHVDTSAVDSILFADADGTNLATGSRFSLYGIKAA